MKSHVQCPHTRSPQLFVHMSVEEVQQLFEAMSRCKHSVDMLEANQQDAFCQMLRVLNDALTQPVPRGIKGAVT